MRGARLVRVYLPATTTVLRRLVDEDLLPGPHTAFAVTEQLRHFYAVSDADADSEELEYAALLAAARASLRLLDVDPLAARRRAVIAAVETDVRMQDVASLHLDGADAEDDVRAAVGVVLEADLGSDDSQFVVDQAEGHELAWYATQEIGPLLDLL
jgi:hypothetical protein